jgi:hypothetical protein
MRSSSSAVALFSFGLLFHLLSLCVVKRGGKKLEPRGADERNKYDTFTAVFSTLRYRRRYSSVWYSNTPQVPIARARL